MNGRSKNISMMILLLAAGIMIAIASGLHELKLAAGMPLPEIEHGHGSVVITDHNIVTSVKTNEFVKAVILFIFVTLFLIMFYRIYRTVGRVNLLNLILRLLLIILGIIVVSGIVVAILVLIPHTFNTLEIENYLPPHPVLRSPLGHSPLVLLWSVIMITACSAVILGMKILFVKNKKSSSIDIIRLEAQKAIDGIIKGLDFKDLIRNCYSRMVCALKSEFGIEKEESMTAGEFENFLISEGAPETSVRDLTGLFEAVRYGTFNPGPLDEQKAVRSLKDIIYYFRSNGGS